jgi:hypothetical protein
MHPIPPLGRRLRPLLLFGYAVAAIRLGLDFWDREAAMVFGLYYLMAVAIIYVGVTRRWGLIGWRAMALTMVCLGCLVWGVSNSISYTVGQFMGWTDGRFDPGTPVRDAAGVLQGYADGRAMPPQDTALGKVGAGLLHGLISSLTGSVWCILFGTAFVWVYRRPAPTEPAGPTA